MKQITYIFTLMALLMLAACSDDSDMPRSEAHICVRCAWHDGLGRAQTRAISDNILSSSAGADIVIPTADYPSVISVTDGGDVSFSLNRSASACSEHSGYYVYTPSPAVSLSDLEGRQLTATATLDGETITCTTQAGQEQHLRFDLHHTRALLRFVFKVAEKYDQIRQIKVTEVMLNGTTCTLADKVLNKSDMQLIAYGYVDPTQVTNTLKCKYSVYDKDGVTPEHLVRSSEATNTFTLSSSIQAGYYYDLNVTLNPDSLHVLSDHDNQQLTIN